MVGSAQKRRPLAPRGAKQDYFASSEGIRIADNLLLYQRNTGGWPKNVDMTQSLSDAEKAVVLSEKDRQDDSTIDNRATTMQMDYLASVYKATGNKKYKDAFACGLAFILQSQYANGGWPQFWPVMRDYQPHITYNDNAIVNVLRLLQSLSLSLKPYDTDIVSDAEREASRVAFSKGIDCILKTQIVAPDGSLTVWCQQHDEKTLRPVAARSYELPSYCSLESAAIIKLLMSIDSPSESVRKAIHSAMLWLDNHKLTDVELVAVMHDGVRTRMLRSHKGAPAIWARYYDLASCRPFVCDRDGIPHKRLEEIGLERRNGYGWYVDSPRELYSIYEKWAAQNDPDNMQHIDLSSDGLDCADILDRNL